MELPPIRRNALPRTGEGWASVPISYSNRKIRAGQSAPGRFPRKFHALFGTTLAYKPSHDQLAKRFFKDFMRAVLDRVFPQWVVGVLQPEARGPLGEFGRVVIQDGASFSVKGALRERYPGRFKKQNPAAVERHVTRSLLDEPVEQMALTADTAPERPPSALARGAAR